MNFIASFAVSFLQPLLDYKWIFQPQSFQWLIKLEKAGLEVYFVYTAQRQLNCTSKKD